MRTVHKLTSGWRIQCRNVGALILRDMMMRYGRHNIGFVWVILEPMILTAGVMGVWSLMGSAKQGVKIVELILTGYMPLTLWRHLTSSVVHIFRNSSPLLYHRNITILDILVARETLEFIGTSAALLVVWGSLNSIGIVADVNRLDLVLVGWFLMATLGFAVGTIIASVTELSETAERFVQPLQYLNIPISGVFFLVDWLPPWAQQAILYHPLVHCYETFRAGYFGEAVTTHYDLAYAWTCAFVLVFIGLMLLQRTRSRVQLS